MIVMATVLATMQIPFLKMPASGTTKIAMVSETILTYFQLM